MMRIRAAALSLVLALLAPDPALASRESDALRQRAFDLAYNLDYEEAMAVLRRAVELDPASPAVYRSVAAITWLQILFGRGAVTVDEYLGRVSQKDVSVNKPPPDLAAQFLENAQKAARLAEAQVERNPNNVDALYELGAAVGLLASYSATVDGKVLAAFRAARRAYNAHEMVLALDPRRKDAALIVGTYRYIVASLSLPVRWIAYVAGFGGGAERGLLMVREAAEHQGDAQAEAEFALVLLYNRERRYGEALGVLDRLQRRYPRNRLLWLETGSTALRGGRPAEAEAALLRGMAMLERDRRPRTFGEEALWRYKRGAVRMALKKREGAKEDLTLALRLEAATWVHGRSHLELGKLADLAGDRAGARREYGQAARLCAAGNDRPGRAEAERWLAQPYKG